MGGRIRSAGCEYIGGYDVLMDGRGGRDLIGGH